MDEITKERAAGLFEDVQKSVFRALAMIVSKIPDFEAKK